MDKKTIVQFKERLLSEKESLERELATIGRRTDGNGAWEATTGGMEVDAADENEVADKFEELEENSGIVDQLEKQLADVTDALGNIEKGTYGTCEICGKPIEIERLEANPSARVSIKHNHG